MAEFDADDAEAARLGLFEEVADQPAVAVLEQVQGEHQAGEQHGAQGEQGEPLGHIFSPAFLGATGNARDARVRRE
ncbi:hypothetical protein GCM10010187_01250 [Actinomadura coerulea]|nr:hypothetical protein GCM10010187_01250 [Actinomadura coerulea]